MTDSNKTDRSNDICLDASLWIRWLTPEEGTEEMKKIISLWMDEYDFFVAPSLLIFEVISALKKKFKQGHISQEKLDEGLELFYDLPIILYQSKDLAVASFEWAQKMGETVVYDTSYLALAAMNQIPFWTADREFFEKAVNFYPDSHLV